MSALRSAIDVVGGVPQAAAICGKSQRAIYKWLAADSLPRTEYTGETTYAFALAGASGGKFTADWLLANARPVRSA